jgi:dipeptidyl-peptidase-3
MSLCKATGTTISDVVKKVLFDNDYMAMKIESDVSKDLVASSAVNFYEGVTTQEVEEFYGKDAQAR